MSALDATRGIAMLLVCTAHFIDVYYGAGPRDNWLLNDLSVVSRIATPSFVLVSGILLGYLSKSTHQAWANLRVHLLDRAIFLITVGHVLMAASFTIREDLVTALSRGYVTDTLGWCVLVGLLVIHYAKTPTVRFWLGLLMYVIGWASWNEWHPDHPVLVTIRGIVLGPEENTVPIFWFPLLPWFGVYLVGSAIGSWLGTFEPRQLSQAGHRLVWWSGSVLGSMLIMQLIIVMLKIPRSIYLPFISYSKSPPGPFYLLTFGSAALLLLGTLLLVSKAPQIRTAISMAERMGRNALSLFITQSFLFYTALYFFLSHSAKSTVPNVFLLLIGSLLCVMWLSGMYDRSHLNRLWTVGLTGRDRDHSQGR